MCSINGTNPMTKDVNVVVSWLVEQGLEEYVTAFQNAGWDNPKTIATLLTEHELLRMGIKKRGHVLQILSSVPKLRRLSEANSNTSFVRHGIANATKEDQVSTVDTLPADLMQLWGELKGVLQSTSENAGTTQLQRRISGCRRCLISNRKFNSSEEKLETANRI